MKKCWWFSGVARDLQLDRDKGNKTGFGSTRENITGENDIKTVNT